MTLLSRPLQRALPLFRLYPSRFPYRLKPTPHARRITTVGKENRAKLPENAKTSVGVGLPENKEEWPSIFGEINSYMLTYGHPMSKLRMPQTSVAENGTRQCSVCNATISWENNAALEFSEEKGIYEFSKSHKCAKCDVNQASIFGTMLSTAEDEIDAFEGAYNKGIELSTASAEDDLDFFNLPELTNSAKAPAVDAPNPAGSNAAAEVTAVKTISNLPKSTTKTKAKTAEIANFLASEKSHKRQGNHALEKKAAAESPKSSRKTKSKSDVEAKTVSDSPKSSTKAQVIQENAVVNPRRKSKAATTGISVEAKAVPNARKSKKTVTKSNFSIEMEAVPNPAKEITVSSDNSAKAVVDPLLNVSQAKPTTEIKKPAFKSKTAAKRAVKANIAINPLQTADSEGKPIVEKKGSGRKSGNNITKAKLYRKANAATDQPMVARRIRITDGEVVLKAPESKNTITETKPALEANATTPNVPKSGKKTEADPTVDVKAVFDAPESVTEIALEAKSSPIPIKSAMKQTAVERELSKPERSESENGILNLGNDQLRHIEAMSALKLKHETMRALLESSRPPQDIVYLWNNFFPRK